MQIRFHGAARTVTGSLHEVRAGGKVYLLDCGMFQGPRAVAERINCCFDFDPRGVEAVILSHAHNDHCGNLPNLVKQGFKGPIYCTAATAALTAIMLQDSAKIQEENAAYLNRHGIKRAAGGGPVEPLYTMEDTLRTIGLFKPVRYNVAVDVGGGEVEFRDAGHALGSAAVKVTEKGTGKVLVFSGDIGRPNAPLLREPEPFEHADAFITECTYGGKTHAPLSEIPEILASIINDTVSRGGVLMVPAFALGRTQTMVQQIHELRVQKRIPEWLPIFVDSPLASKITGLHRQFDELLDEDSQRLLTPFDFPKLTYVASSDESRALNGKRDPFVVIAGSGMCESGRILHHLKHHVSDGRSTVLLPGFQAENTLGRKLQLGLEWVPILGERIPLRCRVETLHGLSAHADGGELVEYSRSMREARTYLVHGEVWAAENHVKALQAAGFEGVTIATRGDVVEV